MESLNSEKYIQRLGSKARIRLFCYPGQGNVWCDIAYRYAKTFALAKLPFRILPIVSTNVLNDPEDRWYSLSEHFSVELSEHLLLNIVCGRGSELFEKHRTDKYKNIAICAPLPQQITQSEKNILEQYDECWCPTWNLLNKGQWGTAKTFCVRPIDLEMSLYQQETVALEVLEKVYGLLNDY